MKSLGRYVSEVFDTAHIIWKKLSIFRRNILVGIIIAILLHVMHSTSIVSKFENWAMDTMMNVTMATPRMAIATNERESLRFTFIDIDEDTYRDWGEPSYSPRDKLLQLIQFAAKKNESGNGAQVIVLDIELSKESALDHELIGFFKEYDKKIYPPLFLLRNFYPKSKCTEEKDFFIRPIIIDDALNKTTLWFNSEFNHGDYDQISRYWRLLAMGCFNDRTVMPSYSKAENINIHWAHPRYELSVYDKVVRYWKLMAIGCLDYRPEVTPSFQLLIDAYLSGPNELRKVIEQLKSKLPKNCSEIEQTEKKFKSEPFFVNYSDKKIKLDQTSNSLLGERIIYTLPWRKEPIETEELYSISANKILKENKEDYYHFVNDRIVVIGGSFSNSRDRVLTPLGEMPGALVVINAIKSLHLFGQMTPPPLLFKILMELALIVCVSWVFAHFGSIRGAVISIIIILISFFPVSFYFFKYGLWIDFAIPLLGIQFHQLIARYEENVVYRQLIDSVLSESDKEIK